MKKADVECAVIGAGPAGLTAAIYLLRFLRKVRLVHHGQSRASWIPLCNNLIGYSHGISGKDLLDRLWSQANSLGLESIEAKAHISLQDGLFVVENSVATFTASKIILATGASDRQPDWSNLNELRESGLLRYCPICDGFEYQGLPLAIVADGEHGLREAKFLNRYSKSILVCVPSEFGVSLERAAELDREGIQITHQKITAAGLEHRGGHQGLLLKFEDGGSRWVRAAYIGLGCNVSTAGLDETLPLERAENGLLKVDSHQLLSIPGAYAAGDCVAGLSQIAVAAGQAAVAAVAVHNAL